MNLDINTYLKEMSDDLDWRLDNNVKLDGGKIKKSAVWHFGSPIGKLEVMLLEMEEILEFKVKSEMGI